MRQVVVDRAARHARKTASQSFAYSNLRLARHPGPHGQVKLGSSFAGAVPSLGILSHVALREIVGGMPEQNEAQVVIESKSAPGEAGLLLERIAEFQKKRQLETQLDRLGSIKTHP